MLKTVWFWGAYPIKTCVFQWFWGQLWGGVDILWDLCYNP